MVIPAWDEAGFTDTRSRLDKPVRPAGHVYVPGTIETDGPFLVWNEEPGWKISRPADDILDRFLRLSSGNSDEILRFARQYGILLVSEDEDGTLTSFRARKGKQLLAVAMKTSPRDDGDRKRKGPGLASYRSQLDSDCAPAEADGLGV